MSTERLLRRATQAVNDGFTGTLGELTATNDTDRIHLHDGSLAGGFAFANHLDLQTGKFTRADAGGTADVITLTLATLGKAPAAYAEYQTFTFKPSGNNTTNVTLNVDGLGAKAVEKHDGSGSIVALAADDLRTGIPVVVIYDGTRFIAQLGGGGAAPGTVLLDTQTASTSASLDFASSIDKSLYKSYFLVFQDIILATGSADLWMRYSDDNGSTYESGANTYESSSNLTLIQGTTDTSWSMTADTGKTAMVLFGINAGLFNDQGINGKTEIYGLENVGIGIEFSNFYVSHLKHRNNGLEYGHGRGDSGSAFTGDIDALQILSSSGNITSGSVRLYGVAI